jgi:hypothetical protein
VVFNTYLVFSINATSISDSCESCVSSHCLRAVRTCGAHRRRVVRAYSSCVILVLSRVVRACGSHVSSHVVCMRRVCHLLMSLALPRIVRTYLACRRHGSRRLLVIINCYRLRTLTLIMLICRVIYFRYLT